MEFNSAFKGLKYIDCSRLKICPVTKSRSFRNIDYDRIKEVHKVMINLTVSASENITLEITFLSYISKGFSDDNLTV
jgi:hypothetical protein